MTGRARPRTNEPGGTVRRTRTRVGLVLPEPLASTAAGHLPGHANARAGRPLRQGPVARADP